jgi:TonB family protein
MSLSVHLRGFGVVAKDRDGLPMTDERTRYLPTEEIHAMLFQLGPDYTRTADDIPQESGVVMAGSPGVTPPSCTFCPPPDYSDAARSAKFQGTVQLSMVVTAQGQATSIYVLKGAPFGLTAKAIELTRRWQFKPAQKDGKPVSVRVQAESTFRLF